MDRKPPAATNQAPVRLGTASGRPPGTASRLLTAKAGGSQAAGGGVALNIALTVEDRPTTQHGLGGLKTGASRGQRIVQDKTYYMGLLRQKVNEINTETMSMRKQIEHLSVENSNFLHYQQKAEKLAAELKEVQGEMQDYNVLIDHLATDSDSQVMRQQLETLKASNDREEKTLESLFARKQEQESIIRQLELEMDQERRMADDIIAELEPKKRDAYEKLKRRNEQHIAKIESLQVELDKVVEQQHEYEADVARYPLKQEAVRVMEELAELQQKKERIAREEQERGTPAEQREKLLAQVKRDNQEIASMERETKEVEQRMDSMRVQLVDLNRELEEGNSELQQKFRELKKREEQMDEFMGGYEESKKSNEHRIGQLEAEIVTILERISRSLENFSSLPTGDELSAMKQDLEVKEGELKKSENTVVGLTKEHKKLQQDVEQIEQLEVKVRQEMDKLRHDEVSMKADIERFSNLDGVKRDAEDHKKHLAEEKDLLKRQLETLEALNKQLQSRYNADKTALNENEANKQMMHLENKWKAAEANNFAAKEYIATKMADCDYKQIIAKVNSLVSDYNKVLLAHY